MQWAGKSVPIWALVDQATYLSLSHSLKEEFMQHIIPSHCRNFYFIFLIFLFLLYFIWQYCIGHLMQRADSLEKTLILWKIEGRRKRGRQRWHYQLSGHEFEEAPGESEGQGRLVCCSPWGHTELDTTERLNRNNFSARVALLLTQWRQREYEEGIGWEGLSEKREDKGSSESRWLLFQNLA